MLQKKKDRKNSEKTKDRRMEKKLKNNNQHNLKE